MQLCDAGTRATASTETRRSAADTLLRREERRPPCRRPARQAVRRWPGACSCFRAGCSRQRSLQAIARSRGLKWSLWRTRRRWTTRGRWCARLLCAAVLVSAYTAGRRCQTWPSAWRRSSGRQLRRAHAQLAATARLLASADDLRLAAHALQRPLALLRHLPVQRALYAATPRGGCARQQPDVHRCKTSCFTRRAAGVRARTLKCRTAFLHRRNGALHTGHR